eukprot:411228-Alexandrium_andersonii.AAC.1
MASRTSQPSRSSPTRGPTSSGTGYVIEYGIEDFAGVAALPSVLGSQPSRSSPTRGPTSSGTGYLIENGIEDCSDSLFAGVAALPSVLGSQTSRSSPTRGPTRSGDAYAGIERGAFALALVLAGVASLASLVGGQQQDESNSTPNVCNIRDDVHARRIRSSGTTAWLVTSTAPDKDFLPRRDWKKLKRRTTAAS